MVSKEAAEIVNKLNIPMLIYEYQTEHTCISVEICPVLYWGNTWEIKLSTPCQDPYDGYRLKNVYLKRMFDPILDQLSLENEVRAWIKELLDFVDKVQNKKERIRHLLSEEEK